MRLCIPEKSAVNHMRFVLVLLLLKILFLTEITTSDLLYNLHFDIILKFQQRLRPSFCQKISQQKLSVSHRLQ